MNQGLIADVLRQGSRTFKRQRALAEALRNTPPTPFELSKKIRDLTPIKISKNQNTLAPNSAFIELANKSPGFGCILTKRAANEPLADVLQFPKRD